MFFKCIMFVCQSLTVFRIVMLWVPFSLVYQLVYQVLLHFLEVCVKQRVHSQVLVHDLHAPFIAVWVTCQLSSETIFIHLIFGQGFS